MEEDATVTAEPAPRRNRRWLHLLLLGLTLVTTLHVGLAMSEGFHVDADGAFLEFATPLRIFLGGVSYAVSIMAILFAHEMGHYLTARRYGVDASPPYYIPMYSLFGTMGAFIRMRLTEKVPGDRFMRIAAFGPLAGFVVTVPVLFVGMALSKTGPTPEDLETGIALGDSLLLIAIEPLFFANLPENHDVWLHPMAFAGWAGLFVTALNLLPLGQLDGGHISFCLFGKKHNLAVPVLYTAFVALTVFVFAGWAAICVFVWLLGVRHPPTCTELPVRGKSRWIGLATVVVFVLSFTPVPFGGMPSLLDVVFR